MKKSLLKFSVWAVVSVVIYGLSKYCVFESLPKAEGFGNYAVVVLVMLSLLIPVLLSLWHLVVLIGKSMKLIDVNA